MTINVQRLGSHFSLWQLNETFLLSVGFILLLVDFICVMCLKYITKKFLFNGIADFKIH